MNSRLRRNTVPPSSLLVAWVAGAVLLAGAMLKGHQLATEPILGQTILDSKGLLSAVVCGELFLGLMLLLCVMPRLAWKSAAICFLVFAGVSAYRQASGHESCGCFGRWSPPPSVTLSLDAAILFALLNAQVPPHTQRISYRRLGFAGTAFLAIALPGGIAIASFSPGEISRDGTINTTNATVLLEPTEWVGRDFPLIRHIDKQAAEQLRHGTWLAVFYHHDCTKCQDVIQSLATAVTRGERSDKLALIELPPYGKAPKVLAGIPYQHIRLSAKWKWFAETPIEVVLHEGMVRQAVGAGV